MKPVTKAIANQAMCFKVLRATSSAVIGLLSCLRLLLALPSSFSSNQMYINVHTVCGQR
ncbi:Uncharacterised protein [Vibrio cholerae]|nr:Uncharacterised protein [Vibrio cholerae]